MTSAANANRSFSAPISRILKIEPAATGSAAGADDDAGRTSMRLAKSAALTARTRSHAAPAGGAGGAAIT